MTCPSAPSAPDITALLSLFTLLSYPTFSPQNKEKKQSYDIVTTCSLKRLNVLKRKGKLAIEALKVEAA